MQKTNEDASILIRWQEEFLNFLGFFCSACGIGIAIWLFIKPMIFVGIMVTIVSGLLFYVNFQNFTEKMNSTRPKIETLDQEIAVNMLNPRK